jgi:hypothetical protein
MKLSEAFPSRYLAAEDIEDDDRTLTITDARAEVMGEGIKAQNKIILSFKEERKELVCNKTNANTISKIHGDDTDDWIGKQITLYATEVEYGGETMLGIRVRLKPAKKAGNEQRLASTSNAKTAFAKFKELWPDDDEATQKQKMRDRIHTQFGGMTAKDLTPDDWERLEMELDAEILL